MIDKGILFYIMDVNLLFKALSTEEKSEMYKLLKKSEEDMITIKDFLNKHEQDLSLRTINCLERICNYHNNYEDDKYTKVFMEEIYTKSKPLHKQRIPYIRNYGQKTHEEVVRILISEYSYTI